MNDLPVELWQPTDKNWRERAACYRKGNAIFFVGRGQDTRPAKEVCKQCSIRELCLEYALRNEERHGIWGGTSERERRVMRRLRRMDTEVA